MGHLQAVLFDLDGTLVDTAADFVRIIHELCEEWHYVKPSATAIRSQVSAGARAMVLLLDQTLQNDQQRLLQLRDIFLRRYADDIAAESCLFPRMNELLHWLEDNALPWGIVTNKPRALSQALLKALELDQRCQVLVCPEDVIHSKPHPEGLLQAANVLGVDARCVVYVGDHPRDIEAGVAAGMNTIAVRYGYLPPQDAPITMWGADNIVDDCDQLLQKLKEM